MAQRFTGLGRGLGSLIPQKPPEGTAEPAKPRAAAAASAPADVKKADGLLHLPLADIAANPEQPRAVFRHHELEDLMNSIREHGILQPLSVSMRPDGKYELIAGERRLRAAKMLGLQSVPVIVRAASTHDKLLLALIENIQREDLNPVEEARGYARLISEFGLTQEAVSKKIGKARSTIANTLRLLELPSEIQDAIASGAVSAGSARAILSLKDPKSQMDFFRKLLGTGVSTRQVEQSVRRAAGGGRKDPAIAAAEEEMRNALGTRVEIKKRGTQGSIVISFYSDEEYDELVRKLST